MRRLDELYLLCPTWGSRKVAAMLHNEGSLVNRKRVQRLRALMGLETIYRAPRLSVPGSLAGRFPYLLRGMSITRPNAVWCADITYIPMARGFLYLFAVMDWASRRILSWEISNTLETEFCLVGLESALQVAGCAPGIFNTDQGTQFTSLEWVQKLQSKGIAVSHDGKGRWRDNVLIERYWRSLKYDDIYPKSYENGRKLHHGLEAYHHLYNHVRPHAALDNLTPARAYALPAVRPAKVVD